MDNLTARHFAAGDCSGQRLPFVSCHLNIISHNFLSSPFRRQLQSLPESVLKMTLKQKQVSLMSFYTCSIPMDNLTARHFAAGDCSGQRLPFVSCHLNIISNNFLSSPCRRQLQSLPKSVLKMTLKQKQVSLMSFYTCSSPMDNLTARHFAAGDCSGQRLPFVSCHLNIISHNFLSSPFRRQLQTCQSQY
ncbi:unnamed protein product [Clavelina lepadiformis]|uniref:Uncharacterized protein n=1 Tax=Clavelina lepadiformis TaxID=159417 RepID=A0ABP0FFQ2_CLALP